MILEHWRSHPHDIPKGLELNCAEDLDKVKGKDFLAKRQQLLERTLSTQSEILAKEIRSE